MSSAAAKIVILISTVGQLFCGMAIVTSASRMTWAFSRDEAVPGHRLWSRLNARRTPALAVVLVCVIAFVLTLPALKGNKAGTTVAFLAVTSIATIALYIAYTIPIYLRWRAGAAFRAGPWTLGSRYRWVNLVAVAWVGLCVVIFCLPFTPAAVPFSSAFNWSAFNYAPVVTGGVIVAVALWWWLAARHTFRGPVKTIDDPAPL